MAVDADRELRDRLRLARAEGAGPITFRRLMRRFASAAEAIEALPGLARAGGRRAAPRVPSAGEAERELEQVARLGARVTVLDRGTRLLGRDDAEAAAVVERAMVRDGVDVRHGAEVVRVEAGGELSTLHVRQGGHALAFEADALLVAVEHRP